MIQHAAVRHKRAAGWVLASLVIEVVLGHGPGREAVTHEARGRNHDEAAARNTQAQSDKGCGPGDVWASPLRLLLLLLTSLLLLLTPP